MTRPLEGPHSQLVDEVAALARRQASAGLGDSAERLARHYLSGLPAVELDEAEPAGMARTVLALLDFVLQRQAGRPSIRVFNPDDGSGRTVVEIVNDDMPFLVDSVAAELGRRGIAIHQLVHPILAVSRDPAGRLLAILPAMADGSAESVMHVEMDRHDPASHADLLLGLDKVLADVRLAVADWAAMRARLKEVEAELAGSTPPARSEPEEAKAFLDWLHDDHFTFLGYRRFAFAGGGDVPQVEVDAAAALGILRDEEVRVFADSMALAAMPPELRAFLTQPGLLLVTKSDRVATVHRPVHMDVIGVKRQDGTGRVVGMHVFLGLFTSHAYTREPSRIPLLRRKVERVMARAGFPRFSHDAKALATILETYPRDELFQAGDDILFDTALGILRLLERPRVALFLRRDEFERFASCLVFLPRDRYDTPLRRAVLATLAEAHGGTVEAWYAQVAEGPLARLHVVVRTSPGAIPPVNPRQLEARLAELCRQWPDLLQEALVARLGESEGLPLARRYAQAFTASYRDRHSPAAALEDVARVEGVLATGRVGLRLYRHDGGAGHEARLKLYHRGGTVALSDVLPILECMGFRVIAEVPDEVRPAGLDEPVWLHDFALEISDGTALELDERRADFEDALARVWAGDAESDNFNRLVLTAGLRWREVALLRAYAKYMRQAGSTYSQAYMERALAENPAAAAALVRLFLAMFDPDHRSGDTCFLDAQVEDELSRVVSADDDRILRRYLNLIRATLRTNYFQTAPSGGPKSYISFKLDSRAIDDLPLPRPLVEIFVYSPRVEAVHLRGGQVARGGIRWSDRREDFRTEILGLMKAQMVKNAVIVPVGAKGGFVVKRPPAGGDRDALRAEGVACYQTMIRGLLDLTDNRCGPHVEPPDGLVVRDRSDPYLVVAADKGTATFSDIANAISLDYGFWLGDAFASGGSRGYDHKAMGITAKGSWEAVKRHFREMGVDVQTQPVTVVGVGDPSGDVFGNAMLCSPMLKLVAAFNHSHIFIDPDPDPAASFAERQRLFRAVKAWGDYDPSLISEGGGVFPRSAKSIPVSAPMRRLFGLQGDQVAPAILIRALLAAPVDLLYFGGIGTYVKASGESNADAGDRANDALRVDGKALRARVVGEGANLAMTQLARVEAALNGLRLNTDAIDNSAGVDTSDHEVNIKILVDELVGADILPAAERDGLLAAMTDEVAALVLRDNYLQTQALSIMESQGIDLLDAQARFMRQLEKAGRLDRGLEFLPSEEALTERAAARRGLTRPELAVLLAYAKIWLNDAVLGSDLPDDPYFAGDLARYFPSAMGQRFLAHIPRHRLGREIVATGITNSMINRVGVSFVADLAEATGHPPADVARAYIVAREAFSLRELWCDVEALDGKVAAQAQIAALAEANRLVERATLWVLRYVPHPFDIGATAAELAPNIQALEAALPLVLPAEPLAAVRARAENFRAQGMPEPVAGRLGNLIVLASAADIVRIGARHGMTVEEAGRLYFAVGERYGMGWLRLTAQRLSARSHWEKLAATSTIEDLYCQQRDITTAVAGEAPGLAPAEALAAWERDHRAAVDRLLVLLAEMKAAPQADAAMLTVATRQLRALVS